jgi:hypothetical protein
MSDKKLNELFNIDGEEEILDEAMEDQEIEEIETAGVVSEIEEIHDAISVSEKIDNALSAVSNIDTHDQEMDNIAKEALASYKDLMDLGMNVADMAAGQVLTNAAQMLKIALDASDAKVKRKLTQIDLMLKKARLDHASIKDGSNLVGGPGNAAVPMTREEVMALMDEQEEDIKDMNNEK